MFYDGNKVHNLHIRRRPDNKYALGKEKDNEMVTDLWLMVHSHLKFIRHELLRELFSPHNHEKWMHNSSLNFSVHKKVDQKASVNAPV